MTTESTDTIAFSPERLLYLSKALALPRWFYDRHADALCAAKLRFRPSTAIYATYPIRIMLLQRSSVEAMQSPVRLVQEIIQSAGTKIIPSICMHGKLFETPIILPLESDVTLRSHDLDDLLTAGPYPEARAGVRQVLANFFRATGWRVRFDYGSTIFAAVHKVEPNVLYVHSDSIPAGGTVQRKLQRLFGVPLSSNLANWDVFIPSTGRERFIKDEKEETAATLIGHDLFPVYPVLMLYYGEDSRRLLQHILRGAWKLLSEKSERRPKANERSFVTAASKWVLRWEAGVHRQIDDLDLKVETAQRELADARRGLILNYSQLAGLGPALFGKATARFPKEFRRIRRMSGVVRIEVDDQGFQWRTEIIVIAHGGRRYRTGPLMIRIGCDSEVSAWSDAPSHPDGIPHPHVNKAGTTCFGNAADALTKLLAGFRYADAVELIMRWLRDGYSHELAPHKIEEWPLEEATDGPKAELVADQGPARSPSDAPDHANRERSGGVVGGDAAPEDGRPVPEVL